MRVIEPISTRLYTSNVPDDDIAAYDPDTTYAAGDRVLVVHDTPTTKQQSDVYVARRSENRGNYPPDYIEGIPSTRLQAEEGSSVAGFQRGEIVGGSGGSGIVSVVSGAAGGHLIVHDVSGSFSEADVVTGAKSGATMKVKESHSMELSAYWQCEGASNRWKMFDSHVNTLTEHEGTIDVTIDAGRCDHLVIMGIHAVDVDIEMRNKSTDEVIFSRHWDMRLDASRCWSDYFFGPFLWQRAITVPIPNYYNSAVRIVIHANPDETARCGHVVVGRARPLGESQWGASVGITDYSRAYTKDDGTTALRQGRWAKELSVDLHIRTAEVDAMQRSFADYRAKPCLWDANNATTNHESLMVYGYYSDFSIVLPGPVMSTCSLTIQGLI